MQRYYDLLFSMWLLFDEVQTQLPTLSLSNIGKQLDTIYDLAKKYGSKVDTVPGYTLQSLGEIFDGLRYLYKGNLEKGAKLIHSGVKYIKGIKVDRAISLNEEENVGFAYDNLL